VVERRRPRSWGGALWALVGLGGVLVIVFALVLGPWLFTRQPPGRLSAEQELKAKNDVRTTLVQALAGLAVAGGLIVTYRTYRQNRVEQDRTYERELYAQAVEQLGHDQAPVRLGALYSLESLAQDRPQRRQTVVDVLCAYLRMPYVPPAGHEPAADHGSARQSAAILPSVHDPAQELQVRQTAQRLLSTHLVRPPDTSGEDAQRRAPSPNETFWPGISLDLTGASLVEFDLGGASVVDASFTKTIFTGLARFNGATFTGDTWFYEATFTSDAMFRGTTFTRDTSFQRAIFTGVALFSQATFTETWFSGARFNSVAMFAETTFSDGAYFVEATFADAALFNEATFTRTASFDRTTFTSDAVFKDTTFTGGADFGDTLVLHLDDQAHSHLRQWPPGWTLQPDPVDPTRGTLVLPLPRPPSP
jgi:hypothetical protein